MNDFSLSKKKKMIFSTFLVSLVICSLTFSTIVTSANTNFMMDTILLKQVDVDDVWPDGTFTGTWRDDITQGLISGILDLGRSNIQGKLQGDFFSETGEPIGSMTGFFNKGRVFGSIIKDSKNVQRFFGSLEYDEPKFSLDINILGGGSLICEGSYESSFLPPLTGEYSVGVKTLHLIDTSREEWFSEDPTDNRELVARIWYPTLASNPQNRIDYMDDATFEWLKEQSPIPLISIPSNAYTFVSPHSYQDAIIAKDNSPYPVLLFSHGYDGVDAIYSSFIEDMVSNGYIVVSINHPYVAGITVFPDGKIIEIAPVPSEDLSGFFARSLRTVIDDVYFVLDTVTDINEHDEIFAGCFDLSRVGMYGHSFGGAATAVCCYEDERFKAGLTLDGVVYDEFLPGDIAKPLLLMLAEGRINDSNTLSLYDKVSTDAYMVGVLGSSHYGYTDVGVLLSHLLPLIPQNLLGFGTIDAKRLVNITRVIELAFFDVYIKGFDEQILFDTFSLFNDVLVQSK